MYSHLYVQCKGNHDNENIKLLNTLNRINHKNHIKWKNTEVLK